MSDQQPPNERDQFVYLIEVEIPAMEARLAAAEAQVQQLREFVTAHTLVEKGVNDFDLQGEAVERLRAASQQPAVSEVIRAALAASPTSES